jgi:hypothetical protein
MKIPSDRVSVFAFGFFAGVAFAALLAVLTWHGGQSEEVEALRHQVEAAEQRAQTAEQRANHEFQQATLTKNEAMKLYHEATGLFKKRAAEMAEKKTGDQKPEPISLSK